MRASVSKQLRVGLIGLGRWGQNLARTALQISEMRLVSICDSEPSALYALSSKLGQSVSVYTSAVRMLSHERLDAVLIATPAATHAMLALRALDAGLRVFVEKPLAHSAASALAIERAAAGRVMVGHLLVFHPAVRELSRLVSTNALGGPLEMSVVRKSLARAAAPCPWWNLGVHDLALAQRWFGRPGRVRVLRGETIRASVEYIGGARLNLSLSAQSDVKVRKLSLTGANGLVHFDDEAVDKLRLEVQPATSTIAAGVGSPLTLELEQFARGCLTGAPFVCDATEGRQVVELLALGEKSMERGGAWMRVSEDQTKVGANCTLAQAAV